MIDLEQTQMIEQILARLTTLPDHPRFVGAPIEISALDGVRLGSIWPAVRRAQKLEFNDPRAEFARWLCKQVEELELVPVLDNASGIAIFSDIEPGKWAMALRDLPYLAEEPTAALQRELIRILGERPELHLSGGTYEAYVLGHFAGGFGLADLRDEVADRYRDSPFRLREFDVLADLGEQSLLALAGTMNGYFVPKSSGWDHNDPAQILAGEPAYVEFAQGILTSAAERVADIQNGKIPFKADGAFTIEDAQVISRAARVAALRDEPWLRSLIGPLLVGVSVAPTAAKTVPSQSVAITLGHSIEAIPTPEGVRALRDALAVVRHAGVEKKLSRNVKPAERALGERPSLALRMTIGAKPDKQQQKMLAACMDAGFWQSTTFSTAEWRERLIEAAAGAAFASKVIWMERRANGTNWSFMVDISKNGTKARDVSGAEHQVEAFSTISLWHPLNATTAERQAWQRVALARKIAQPIRQAFREYYVPIDGEENSTTSSIFEGHVVSVRPLVGLARREGWSINKYDGLGREFGDVKVTFSVSADLYPGATGHGIAGKLQFARKSGRRWSPVTAAQLDPTQFSEIARAADLLVSVAAFAVDDESSRSPTIARTRHLDHLSALPLGVMASNRKNTLAMVFSRQIAEGAMSMDERHLRVGEYAIHLATARVTRNGEPIEIEADKSGARLSALPWLPYDEVLLQRIVDVTALILQQGSAPV